jgi:hypothetical protein
MQKDYAIEHSEEAMLTLKLETTGKKNSNK